jgi:hypothetical protein
MLTAVHGPVLSVGNTGWVLAVTLKVADVGGPCIVLHVFVLQIFAALTDSVKYRWTSPATCKHRTVSAPVCLPSSAVEVKLRGGEVTRSAAALPNNKVKHPGVRTARVLRLVMSTPFVRMVLESTAGLQVVLIAHKPDQKLDQENGPRQNRMSHTGSQASAAAGVAPPLPTIVDVVKGHVADEFGHQDAHSVLCCYCASA